MAVREAASSATSTPGERRATLRDLPELLSAVDQADRAALYQALGLTVAYGRVGTAEEVKLRAVKPPSL